MSIVKSFAVGEGDMLYIQNDSDNFTLFDCYVSQESRTALVEELQAPDWQDARSGDNTQGEFRTNQWKQWS